MDFEVEVAQIIAARAERRAAFKKLPYISVVMATARPDDLTNILTQIEAQTLPSFELLLGVHKFQLSPSHKKQLVRLQKRGISVVTKNFTVAYTLGSVLSTMAAQSTGEYIAKMDDDDIYGPDHLRDLLEIALTNGAEVVGKAMNYIYLQAIDLTVRRVLATGISTSNLWTDWVCGGTILAKRSAAEAVGWFGEGKSAVDHFLLSGIKKNGGKIWRAPGLGYIYKRSVVAHTYVTNYSKYLRETDGQRVGFWPHEEFGTAQ